MEQTTKNFRKRNAILSCLRATDTHPDADWIWSQVKNEIPDISLATVYRNLALFKQRGVIASVGTVAGVERFDANTTPHVHFICTDCGAVQDLHSLRVPDSLGAEAEKSCGGCVRNCSLSFTGICANCLQNPKNPEQTL